MLIVIRNGIFAVSICYSIINNHTMKKLILIICSLFSMIALNAQPDNYYKDSRKIYLDSKEMHQGAYEWLMMKVGDVNVQAEQISTIDFSPVGWMPAVVPGTVLRSLIYNKVYPVDMPGTVKPKSWGAAGEFRNGGDGNIGLRSRWKILR